MRITFLLLIVFLLCPHIGAQDKSKLLLIKKIFIAELGKEESSDLIREKIRIRLMKTDRFTIVETPDEADAILVGVAGVERSQVGSVYTNPSTGATSGSTTTTRKGVGVFRLIDAKTKETIWIYEYKRGFSFSAASNRVADKTVEQLLKDAKEANKEEKKK